MSQPTRNTNFGVVLYPDCLEHRDMLKFLEGHSYQFQIVYILHDKDVYYEDTEDHKKGELKKSHYHVLVHCKNAKSLKSFLDYFAVWIDYAEVISDCDSYVHYMLHDTPNSLHKFQYDVSLLQGDKNLIRKFVQKTHFVQLTEVLDTLQDNGGRMVSLLRSASLSERDDLLEVIKQYQSLICTCSNQEFKLFMENLKK